MKIGGTAITPPSKELFVIPRDGGDLVFWAQAIPSWDEFDKKCPEPDPPAILKPDGKAFDYEDANYLTQVANHRKYQLGYLVVKTLEPSNIEWDTVQPNNPGTWANWQEDFRNAGLTQPELNKLFSFVMDANNLSDAKLKAAREAFLRGRQPA